jgi:membrane protein YdbS with pleckstrin-like domain
MAKLIQKEKITKKKTKRIESLSLEKINYLIILSGIVVILAGYIALSTKPWDNSIALTIAPVLLVLGYCVIIPIGIIFRKKKTEDEMVEQQLVEQQ